ncbi:GntR family transcriptional regulator [Desertimonas flava]|jgi:DNA-binding GntR family transcriptional regulator|uniref:GntR family transcriptional regulator n=1 Tax=Desertimonas flava TaxID=2064846 RepID=UPI000E350797|nr:GntR family transcriptional regulator [Desertimonas flava]
MDTTAATLDPESLADLVTGQTNAVAGGPAAVSEASAADRAYAYVRGEVLCRRIAGNDLITEGQIADAVGVSRTPVREALLRLQADGMVRLLPKRGALVLPVTAEEMADVLETRRLVETFAARRAVTDGSPTQLVAALQAHIDDMRDAAKRRDTVAYVEADRAFHLEIVAAAGNEILTTLYRSLRDRQLRMGVVNLLADGDVDPARMRRSADEHEQITQAIASRSVRAVDAAVDAHLDDAGRLLSRRR